MQMEKVMMWYIVQWTLSVFNQPFFTFGLFLKAATLKLFKWQVHVYVNLAFNY